MNNKKGKNINTNKMLMGLFLVLIILLVIPPNIPYKIPMHLKDSKYTELEIYMGASTGGPGIKNGGEKIAEYAKTRGYNKVNTKEIYLSGENNPRTIITTYSEGYLKYEYFRIYGEFVKGPDKYGVLTFNVKGWYPIDKYVHLYDTKYWDKYRKIYRYCLYAFSIIFIILYVIILAKKIKDLE